MSAENVHIQQIRLRVAVIGGGIAGISTAAFLWKHQQFSMTVYERRDATFAEATAAIGIRTNGILIIKQLGMSRQEIQAVLGAGYKTYNLQEVEMSRSEVGDGLDCDGALWFVFRQDLKDVLLARVMCKHNEGEPMIVVYGSHVVRVEPEEGFVDFANGSRIEADLIVGTYESIRVEVDC